MTSVTVPPAGSRHRAPPLRRTDPRSLLVTMVSALPNMAVPILALLFSTRGDRLPPSVVGSGIVLLALLLALAAWLRWHRTQFAIGTDYIRLETGLLARSARSLPFDRVQDVSLEQPLLARMFGLAAVKFETGAGKGEDLSLTYLPLAEGEALRDAVRRRRDDHRIAGSPSGAKGGDACPDDEESVLFALSTRRLFALGLFRFSLVVVALLAGAVQQFDFLLPFDPYAPDTWEAFLAGPGSRLAAAGAGAQTLGALLGAGVLLLIGIATGMVRTVLTEWGFTLTRSRQGFRRRRGLLHVTDVVMPVHRVQAVLVTTGIVRARLGWYGAKFVSLAGDAGAGDHVVVPLGRWAEVGLVAAAAGFPLPDAGTMWTRVSPLHPPLQALATAGRWAVLVLGASAVLSIAPVAATVPAGPWIPALIALAVLRTAWVWLEARRQEWSLDATHLRKRGGWLSPRLQVADRERIQSVTLRRGPLLGALGLVDVHLGIAGGRLMIPALPLPQARRLRHALLDSMRKRDFSALV
ncbi:hypothetical protein EYB45_03480 [Erythrobacteraceae bacterium CFH 75059]|uniref:PH domain-containing protein n=1 Tax=Qipengyuania thermophila TaxID=2509361 RepID=UPI00102246E8|nr:PH domain-containing protein [Qipengyuania thermophila]TCD06760.1 hypothetical protein EYB45_03480 [Erythrobacteraceae bacterium CFH 75059]